MPRSRKKFTSASAVSGQVRLLGERVVPKGITFDGVPLGELSDVLGLRNVVNVEGMTWGPRLSTGERSLVFVSDDGLSDEQITQVVALAVRGL